METKPTKLIGLSASRVKTLDNCSFLYWSNYHLKLPQIPNNGAKIGTICHLILEVLQNKRHFHHYKTIIEKDSIMASSAVAKLINKHIVKLSLQNHPNVFESIAEMIFVGLISDFFIKNGELVATEFEFDIENENPKYRIKGFMDKPVKVGNEIIIDDYKSSKKKFEGEDQESNLQALIYSLAAKKLWPELTPKVRFIFLQYPDDPIMEVKFSEDALYGLEFYLEEINTRVAKFDLYDATQKFAAKIQPEPGEFKGKLLCGFAKYPGQLKKDGTKMWHCSYKFPFDYIYVKFADGTEKTYFTEEEVPQKETLIKEKRHYDGCPYYYSPALMNLKAPVQPTKEYKNVLLDF